MENNNTESTHPFEKTLGAGPYKVVGFMSISGDKQKVGGDKHLTKHPQWKGGCGTCQHCGMAIMEICVVRVGNGDLHGIGTTCVLKTHMPKAEQVAVENWVKARQSEKRADLYNRKKNAVAEAINRRAEELKLMPHPSEYFATRGRTYLDYCEFAVKGNWKSTVNNLYKEFLSKKFIDRV